MIGNGPGPQARSVRAGPLGWLVHRGLWAGVLGLALAVGIWRPGESEGIGGRLEGLLLDTRFVLRGPLEPPEGVAILAIDDAEIARHDRFPPPRSALADAVDAATKAGAAAVALDLLLVGAMAEDARLAAALQRNGRAVLAAAAMADTAGLAELPASDTAPSILVARSQYPVVTGHGARNNGVALTGMLMPTAALGAHAALGSASIVVDRDGSLRRMPAALAVQPPAAPLLHLPGLAIAALQRSQGPATLMLPRDGVGGRIEVGGRSAPLDATGSLPLVHYGPAGTIPTWPLRAAASADLSGRIVFIGATATGFGDVYGNPFDPALAGVEAHATLAANLLEGRALRRDAVAWLADLVACLCLAALAFWAASRDRPRQAALACSGVAVVAAGALQGAFVLGWWADGVSWFGALAAGAVGGGLLRVLRDRRRLANLALYQSPALAEMLARDGRPGFDGQILSCGTVFADIAGFTTYTQRAGPDAAGDLMRAFQDSVTATAQASGGIVTQFSGDGAMVVFGLLDRAAPADDALRFVAGMTDAAGHWPVPELRMGAHLGPVAAGVMGGRVHRQVSVAGDAVNVARRLQEEAKIRQAALAVSDSLLVATRDPESWADRLGLSAAGPCEIRGREGVLEIWTAGAPLG